MRFINLKSGTRKSCFDSLIEFGCGPNFVLNRLDSFELMIKEQGVTFWFRYWLTFSLNPPCELLQEINKEWPGKISQMTIEIHKQFLTGSVEDTVKYCLEKLIMQLRNPKIKLPISDDQTLKKQFSNLLSECVEMTFGAALCETFFIWLNSSNVNESEDYWSIPEEYQDPDFEEKELEKFMIDYWKEGLIPLLGIKLVRQSPWLLKWTTQCSTALKSNQVKSTTVFDDGIDLEEYIYLSPYLINIRQVMEKLRKHRDDIRVMIPKVDEVPDMAKIWSTAKLASKMEQVKKKVNMLSVLLEKFTREKKFEPFEAVEIFQNSQTRFCDDKKQLEQCARCSKELTYDVSRVCKRCIAENWLEKRYYCSDESQNASQVNSKHLDPMNENREI